MAGLLCVELVKGVAQTAPKAGIDEESAPAFLDLTVRITVLSWNTGPNGPQERTYTNRCVVGTNVWLIQNEFSVNSRNKYFFDGQNLYEQQEIIRQPASTVSGIHYPKVGEQFVRHEPSVDGNPGRPPRVSDKMDFQGRVIWTAFCSGACLSQKDHKLYPPDDLWKEFIIEKEFSDASTRYDDAFAFPKTLLLLVNDKQPVVDYRVSLSTNFCSLTIPTQFYLAQYQPTGTKGWMLAHISKGEVISLAVSVKPSL